MTERTYSIELTARQADEIFSFINIASIYYQQEVDRTKPLVGVYDMTIATVDELAGKELMIEIARTRWIEFYQYIKKIRTAERGAEEGGAA